MIFATFLMVRLMIHPLHVSVSDVTFKEDKRVIQISTRIFLDDLERTLANYSTNEALDIMKESSWDQVNDLLKIYMLDHLRISNEKGPLQLNYIGAEIEEEVMWVYLEIEKVKKLNKITIWNDLLMETFDDQENIVHFRAFGKVKSERFSEGEESQIFNWNH